MATRALWAESLAPGLRAYVKDVYNKTKPFYPQVFDVMSSDKADEDFINSSGIGLLLKTSEQGPINYEDPFEIYKTTLAHQKFSKGISVTREAFDDDLYNVWTARAATLGRSAARTSDMFAFDVFRGAFTTTKTSYGDGKPLCSTSHTRKDGGTAQSNASSTGIPLSEPNLEVGTLALQEVVDDKGQIITMGEGGIVLMVALANRKEALVYTNSILQPDSAQNNINVYQSNGAYSVIANPFIGALAKAVDGYTLGVNTNWFLIDKTYNGLKFLIRKAFYTTDDYVNDTETLRIQGIQRHSAGWIDWRGVWGSKGDSAAYSS